MIKKPKNDEQHLKRVCDLVVEQAAQMMVEAGACRGMILDRLFTYAAAQIAVDEGSPKAAKVIRQLADNVERGCFHPITGEGQRH